MVFVFGVECECKTELLGNHKGSRNTCLGRGEQLKEYLSYFRIKKMDKIFLDCYTASVCFEFTGMSTEREGGYKSQNWEREAKIIEETKPCLSVSKLGARVGRTKCTVFLGQEKFIFRLA